jgi:hypothetical protein
MARKTILHFTGMKNKKSGSLERYFIKLVKLCNQRGYCSTLQYDFPLQSTEYLRELENLRAQIVVLDTHGGILMQ